MKTIVKKFIRRNKHLIFPFLIVGITLLFIIFSLGVPENEEMAASGGCGADVDKAEVDIDNGYSEMEREREEDNGATNDEPLDFDGLKFSKRTTCRTSEQMSIYKCLSVLGSKGGLIVVSKDQVINEKIVIPSSIAIQVEKKARFRLEENVPFQIEGPFSAPRSEIFLGSGIVRFANRRALIYSAWWGHKSRNGYERNDEIMRKAMDALPNGGTVRLERGTFYHKLIEAGNNVALEGDGCIFNNSPQCLRSCNDGCTNNPEAQRVPACCKTIIKLPDFPDNDEERFLFPQQENFVTCKSGVEKCSFKNFEYDGNAQSNMNWRGSRSNNNFPNWTRQDMPPLFTHGIYGDQALGRIAPRSMRIENLYVHDTIRDGIVMGGVPGGTTIEDFVVKNVRVKNSLLDHLIYISQTFPVKIENVLLEGFWAGPAIVMYGPSLKNLFFKNMAQNPIEISNPETDYKTMYLIAVRSSTGENIKDYNYEYHSPAKIDGVTAEINNNFINASILTSESLDINNIRFILGPERQNPFYVISANLGPAQTAGFRLLNGENIDVSSGGSSTILLNTQGELPIANIHINGVSVNYEENPSETQPLISFRGPAEGVTISNITINGAGQRLITTAEGRSIRDITISDVSMCDARPEPNLAYLGSDTELLLRNAQIHSFNPNMILRSNSTIFTEENVGECARANNN